MYNLLDDTELTQETITILVGVSFPWRIWMGKLDLAGLNLIHIQQTQNYCQT